MFLWNVGTYKSTLRYKPEDQHRSENFKSHAMTIIRIILLAVIQPPLLTKREDSCPTRLVPVMIHPASSAKVQLA
jgi:hypothetical protein